MAAVFELVRRRLNVTGRSAIAWAVIVLAANVPVAGQTPGPGGFIAKLSPEETAEWSTADFSDALAREARRLLETGDYENATAYCEYALRPHRLCLLAHWVIWQALALEAEDAGEVDLEEQAEEWAGLRKDQPEDPVAIFRGAVADEYRGAHEAALEAYGKLGDEFPGHAVLHLRLGVVLSEVERYEDAVAELEAALELDEELVEAYEPLALGLVKLGHFEAAAVALDKAVESDRLASRAHYLRGVALFAQGKRGEALGSIAAGTGRDDSSSSFLQWTMSAWSVGADWASTLALWVVTTGGVVLFLCLAARERPGVTDLWVAGGHLLLVLGLFCPWAASRFGTIGPSDWTQAGVMYIVAAAAFGPIMVADMVWNAMRGTSRSKQSLLIGFAWPWAVIMFIVWLADKGSEYGPSLVPIIVIPMVVSIVLGRGSIIRWLAFLVHGRARRYEEFIAWLGLAMGIDGSKSCRASCLVWTGQACTALGRYEEALAAFEEGVNLGMRPQSGQAAAAMAGLLGAMGRYDEAWEMQGRSVELCGSLGFGALPDVCEAALHIEQEQYEAGAIAARRAIGKGLVPRDIRMGAQASLGRALAMLGDFTGGTHASEQAMKSKSAFAWASTAETTMGIMWSSSGHWQEAAEHFARALEHWENNADAQLRAAQAHAMLGHWERAEALLTAARDHAPESRLAGIAKGMLEQGAGTWQHPALPMPQGAGQGP